MADLIFYAIVGVFTFGFVFRVLIPILISVAIARRQQDALKKLQQQMSDISVDSPQHPLRPTGLGLPTTNGGITTSVGAVRGGHVIIPGVSPKWRR